MTHLFQHEEMKNYLAKSDKLVFSFCIRCKCHDFHTIIVRFLLLLSGLNDSQRTAAISEDKTHKDMDETPRHMFTSTES